MALLINEKVNVATKYSDYTNIFSKKSAEVLA